ncbi:hypothetical protein GW17_00018651 [Ensete ventricosum]|nr:hypothetical protein GW17_00018651 [Ensete ventricosum]
MHSFAVDAVAGYRLQRAVAERLAGQVADDSVTTLHLLAIAPVTSVTTHAFRALLERLHQHAAVGRDVHVADRSVLDGRERKLHLAKHFHKVITMHIHCREMFLKEFHASHLGLRIKLIFYTLKFHLQRADKPGSIG